MEIFPKVVQNSVKMILDNFEGFFIARPKPFSALGEKQAKAKINFKFPFLNDLCVR